MNPFFRAARRLQNLGLLLPRAWQLPVRYRIQSLVNGLEPEVHFLHALVPAGTVAIDVGANMGVYTYALSRVASRVHAVEPQAACCETIAAWARKRGNVDVHNMGVGATSDRLTLYIPRQDGRPVGTRASFIPVEGDHVEVHVPVRRLDDLGLSGVGFIKVDAEGFERDVLEGARGLLARDRPVILIEIDPGRLSPADFAATFALLEGQGYAAHYLEGDRLVACDASIQGTRPEQYNFVFKTGHATR